MGWFDIFTVDFSALDNAAKIEAWAVLSQTVAAVLSLAALVLSLWVFSRQQQLDRWQLRLHREDHIINWSQNCITLMAEVEEYLKLSGNGSGPALAQVDYIRLRSRLSALIDEGRLYFPNLRNSNHGHLKNEAYKGHRQPILDRLVEAYDNLRAIQEGQVETGSDETIAMFNNIRRAFVSEAQQAVDPRLFNRIRA